MNKINVLKGLFVISLSLSSVAQAMDYGTFFAKFQRTGRNGPTFKDANVRDFPSFFAEFQRTGRNGPSFKDANVRDFQSFLVEYNRTGGGYDHDQLNGVRDSSSK